MSATADSLTKARMAEMLRRCPFHRLLGLEFRSLDPVAQSVVLSLDVRPDLSRRDDGIELHGGVIASILDVAGDFAVALVTGRTVPTIGMSIDYLRMARGNRALAQGRVVKAGRNVAVTDMELRDESGTLVAIGRGTYATAQRTAG